MGLLNRKSATVEPDEVARPEPGSAFHGETRAIIFREGFHYPLRFDADGNELGPDLETPLVWKHGSYHHALPDEPNHFHRYGLKAAEIEQVA